MYIYKFMYVYVYQFANGPCTQRTKILKEAALSRLAGGGLIAREFTRLVLGASKTDKSSHPPSIISKV